MQTFPINYWAVGVATLAKFLLGWLWYSPFLFGKQWQALSGVTAAQMKAGMLKAILADLVGTFVLAWVLVHAVHYAGAASLGQGVAVGFFNWLGFIGAASLAILFYEQRPPRLVLLYNGYMLLSFLIMGGILAVWT
jgi:hypothetical protein